MRVRKFETLALLGIATGLAVTALPIEGQAGITAYLAVQCGVNCGSTDNTSANDGQGAAEQNVEPGDVQNQNTQPSQKKQLNTNNQ